MKNLAPRETEERTCVDKIRHLTRRTPQGPQGVAQSYLRAWYRDLVDIKPSFDRRKCAAERKPISTAEKISRSRIEAKLGPNFLYLTLEDNTYPRPLRERKPYDVPEVDQENHGAFQARIRDCCYLPA